MTVNKQDLIEQVKKAQAEMREEGQAGWPNLMDEVLAALQEPDNSELVFDDYDAGDLNDHGGGDIDWWQDYIRAEIERANEHWQSQITALQQSKPVQQDTRAQENLRELEALGIIKNVGGGYDRNGSHAEDRYVEYPDYYVPVQQEVEKPTAKTLWTATSETNQELPPHDSSNIDPEEARKAIEQAQQPNIGDALREKLEGMRFDLSLLAASDACFNELEAKCEAFDEAISIADSMSGVTAQPIGSDKSE